MPRSKAFLSWSHSLLNNSSRKIVVNRIFIPLILLMVFHGVALLRDVLSSLQKLFGTSNGEIMEILDTCIGVLGDKFTWEPSRDK
ncbi:MAG: hypothetical protein QXJ64_10735 [Thermosphaera sp.]